MPKKYLLKFRAVNRDTFEAIRSGEKKIETRAATERYRNIRAGDVVVLSCGKQKFQRAIKSAQHFKSIPALFKKYKIKEVMPEVKTLKEAEKVYYSYPAYEEKIKKFGLIALELEP